MAKENRPPELIEPEQRAANRLSRRLRLSPPVDVVALAGSVARVEQDYFPGESDAVVYSRPREKPVIVLNRSKSPTRKRFTLAHEIGHIVLPWHVGTMACCADLMREFDDFSYTETEGEANRFASELLMPREWLRGIVRRSDGLRVAFSVAKRKADVSAHALSLAIIRVLPPGYVFAVIDIDRTVTLAGISPGTLARKPGRGDLLNIGEYDQASAKHVTIEGIHWWYFDQKSEPPSIDSTRSASEILRDILESLPASKASAEKLLQSVNGIIGAANGAIQPKSLSELFAGLRQRFLSRPDLRNVIQHKEFEAFLARRSEEIFGRRRSTRRSKWRRGNA